MSLGFESQGTRKKNTKRGESPAELELRAALTAGKKNAPGETLLASRMKSAVAGNTVERPRRETIRASVASEPATENKLPVVEAGKDTSPVAPTEEMMMSELVAALRSDLPESTSSQADAPKKTAPKMGGRTTTSVPRNSIPPDERETRSRQRLTEPPMRKRPRAWSVERNDEYLRSQKDVTITEIPSKVTSVEEQRAATELKRMRQQAVIDEPERNSKREELDMLKALLAKHGQTSLEPDNFEWDIPSAEEKSQNAGAPVTAEFDPATFNPAEAAALYQSGPKPVESAPKVPEFDPYTSNPAEAAALFQSGPRVPVESAPKATEFDPSKLNPAEAAALYQSGPKPTPLEEVRDRMAERAKKTEGNETFRAEDMRLKMEEKQREEFYFRALRRDQINKGFGKALGERLGFTKGKNEEPLGQMHALRQGWVESRAERTRHMLDSIQTRREGRGGAVRQNRDEAHVEKIRERYQRMYVLKEAVFGAEEAEQKVRSEGLSARDRNIVDFAWKKYQALPTAMKAIPTAVAAGTALAFGAAVPAAVLVGLGAGSAALNMAAESARKNGHTKAAGRLSGATKFITFGGLGGMVGRMFGRGLNKNKAIESETTLAGKKKGETLTFTDTKGITHVINTENVKGTGDLRTNDAYVRLSEQRRDAALTKEMVNNRVTTSGAVGAMAASAAGGAAVGMAFGHHAPVHHAYQSSSNGSPLHHGEAPGHPGGHHSSAEGKTDSSHPEGFNAIINHRGEGADKLYMDMRHQLEAAYGKDLSHAPPVVHKLLEFKNADEFSRATGLENLPNSAVMHMKDSFTLSPDGKTFSFLDNHGQSHVLIGETPQHEAVVISQQADAFPMRDYSHHTPTHQPVQSHTAPVLKGEVPPAPVVHIAEPATPNVAAPSTQELSPNTPPAPYKPGPDDIIPLDQYNAERNV